MLRNVCSSLLSKYKTNVASLENVKDDPPEASFASPRSVKIHLFIFLRKFLRGKVEGLYIHARKAEVCADVPRFRAKMCRFCLILKCTVITCSLQDFVEIQFSTNHE